MNRGIIFSTDAALALIVVIILAAWITVQFNAAEEKGAVFESLHNKALDWAITEFYRGGTTVPATPGVSVISDTAEFGECAVFYTLDPDNGPGRAAPVKQTFCEEWP